ncbi:hypothetical protein DYB28_010348, partial [Aphanomyces astaci]
MLRHHPHLGISLPHGESITSIYFADDSTLLSKDLPSAVEQLGIVEEFCAVSGARLNQSKCQTLVLNGNLDPADTDAAMTQSTAGRPLWQLVLWQFERSMGQLYRASNPYDFLLYHPHPSSKWLMLWEVHPLWID